MDDIDILNKNKMSSLRAEIKSKIFEDIRNRRLFGKKYLWQFYMIREFYAKYPKKLREEIDISIQELEDDHILEPNDHGYKLTSDGEKLVYDNNLYSIESTIEKILIYLRENSYYENFRWPLLTALSFSETLNVYEERLFNEAIKKMVEDKLFEYDESHLSYIVTHKCEQTMFGLNTEEG